MRGATTLDERESPPLTLSSLSLLSLFYHSISVCFCGEICGPQAPMSNDYSSLLTTVNSSLPHSHRPIAQIFNKAFFCTYSQHSIIKQNGNVNTCSSPNLFAVKDKDIDTYSKLAVFLLYFICQVILHVHVHSIWMVYKLTIACLDYTDPIYSSVNFLTNVRNVFRDSGRLSSVLR